MRTYEISDSKKTYSVYRVPYNSKIMLNFNLFTKSEIKGILHEGKLDRKKWAKRHKLFKQLKIHGLEKGLNKYWNSV